MAHNWIAASNGAAYCSACGSARSVDGTIKGGTLPSCEPGSGAAWCGTCDWSAESVENTKAMAMAHQAANPKHTVGWSGGSR